MFGIEGGGPREACAPQRPRRPGLGDLRPPRQANLAFNT